MVTFKAMRLCSLRWNLPVSLLLWTPLLSGSVSATPPAVPQRSAPPTTAIAMAPDGGHVVLGSQAGIELRSWPELASAGQLATHMSHVHDLAFSPDGKQLLAAGGSPAEVGSVELWSWPEPKLISQVTSHDDVVTRARWSPDSLRFATAGADSLCQVHSIDATHVTVHFKGHSRSPLALCFLPEGNAIISGGIDQTVQVWDSQTGTLQKTFTNHAGSVNDLAIKPLSATPNALPVLASASDDRTVRLWQPTIGRMVRFVKLSSVPHALIWSPTGDRLLVGCDDGRVRVLDGDTLEVIKSIDFLRMPVIAMALDPSGQQIIVASAGEPKTIRW